VVDKKCDKESGLSELQRYHKRHGAERRQGKLCDRTKEENFASATRAIEGGLLDGSFVVTYLHEGACSPNIIHKAACEPDSETSN
jgi:hypothetical protein